MEEVIQIWMNLPARLKMTKPNYTGLQKDKIPAIPFDNGKGTLHLTSGTFNNTTGPVESLTELFTSTIDMNAGAAFTHETAEGSSVLLYVIDGSIGINGVTAKKNQLVQLSLEGNAVSFEALEDSKILFCFGMPFNEPIVAQGPFVMNTQQEIYQAFADYQSGKLGGL